MAHRIVPCIDCATGVLVPVDAILVPAMCGACVLYAGGHMQYDDEVRGIFFVGPGPILYWIDPRDGANELGIEVAIRWHHDRTTMRSRRVRVVEIPRNTLGQRELQENATVTQ